MGRSFKLHAGLAAGCSVVLLVLAALTLLPQPLVLPNLSWWLAGSAALLFPVFFAAVLRGMFLGLDRRAAGLVFRQLPIKVQLGLGALLVAGFALSTSTAFTSDLKSTEVAATAAVDQRSTFAVLGSLFAGAATFVLIAGEVRRRQAEAQAQWSAES